MKGIHIVDTSRVLDSYCHFQIHTGHTQTFHSRGSKFSPCAVARDVPLLISDPYTRKRGVYMFVGSFTFVMVQRTLSEIWPRFSETSSVGCSKNHFTLETMCWLKFIENIFTFMDYLKCSNRLHFVLTHCFMSLLNALWGAEKLLYVVRSSSKVS